MEIEALRNILRKVVKSEILNLMRKWGFLDITNISQIGQKTTSKISMISNIVKMCERKGLSSKEVGRLDLLYIQSHSRKKLWHVFELQDRNGDPRQKISLPALFEKKFKKNMDSYFGTDVHVCKYNDAFWIRVYIHGNNRSKYIRTNTAYMVYYPGSSYILMSQIKEGNKKYILQALLNTVGYVTASQMELRGHCVSSLAQLALNRTGQGSLKEFLPKEQDGVLSTFSKKRKELDDDLGHQISDEDKQQKRRRLDLLENTYGTGRQPTLEKIDYNLKTTFQGGKYVPGMKDEPFHCKVKFEGLSVIEGIRNLGVMGLAKVPMPSHLTAAPLKGRNSFNIKLRSQTT